MYRRELHDIGVAMNLAFANPKQLPKLLEKPKPPVTNESVHPILRVSRSKPE